MVNTGNKIITEQDMNPLSETYGDTRETIVYDAVTCPPGIDFKARYSTTQASNKYIYCNGETELMYNEVPYNGTTSITVGNCVTTIGSNFFNKSGYYNTTLSTLVLSPSVTAIRNDAFHYCSGLSSVTFAEGLTSIGNGAFASCQSLRTVTLPNSLTYISSSAFAASGLRSITIPNGVTDINNNAFSNCTNLATVTIGSGITVIGGKAFTTGSNMSSFTINATTPPRLVEDIFSTDNNCPIYVPSGTLSTYESAQIWATYFERIFEYGVPKWVGQSFECEVDEYDELTGYVTVTEKDTNPSSPTYNTTRTITYEDLVRCSQPWPTNRYKLYYITLGGNTGTVECDGNGMLNGFNGRNYVTIDIGNCVSAIGNTSGDGAFQDCASLATVTMADSVRIINQMAFYGCRSLTSLSLSENLTFIGNYAFRGCSRLTSVTIPSGVTDIGASAFYYCSGLTSFTCLATTPPTLAHSSAFTNTNNCPIYVPAESVQAYKTATNWSNYASRIQAIPNS